MSEALKQLLGILKLEKIDTNLYRGITPETSGKRVFGGQVFAQAMRAAQDTVDSERMVHSQHAYFLRPGDPSVPILYDVDNIRDGGSFTTRRVVASQRGKAIFNTSLSFQILIIVFLNSKVKLFGKEKKKLEGNRIDSSIKHSLSKVFSN